MCHIYLPKRKADIITANTWVNILTICPIALTAFAELA